MGDHVGGRQLGLELTRIREDVDRELHGLQMITTENGANIDFMNTGGEITPQHYAFLVSESEFDEIFGRIRKRSLPYWANPAQEQSGEINYHDGGRGVYFEDPDGHLLEVISAYPVGSAAYNIL